MPQLDVIIIGGDKPLEVLGEDVRDRSRLHVDGMPASLPFLREYFLAGRDASAAAAALRRQPPSLALNGPYLCRFLEDRGFTSRWIPLLATHEKEFLAAIEERPRAVVISTTFLPFAAEIDRMARWIKDRADDVPVIAGGIQVWKSYQHRLRFEAGDITPDIAEELGAHNYLIDATRPSPVDLLVISERGEETLAKILAALRDGCDAKAVENVAYFAGGKWRISRVVREPYHEVSVDWSEIVPGGMRQYVPVQAGQGCGFRCAFCDFSGLRSPRSRPVDSIIREIGTIPEVDGERRVYFTDDNLFADRRRARSLCQALIDSGCDVQWRGMVRLPVLDEEITDLMARSGCREVLLGIESGDPGILRAMGKAMSPDDILSRVRLLNGKGIHTKNTFIVGYPGETARSLRNTVELLNAYPVDGPAGHRHLFFTFAVLPLSRVASPESRAAYGLRGYGFRWKHNTMSSHEAARHLAWVQEAIKPELSPNYMLEVPDIEGVRSEDIKEVYLLRNLIAGRRRSPGERGVQESLWDRLEAVFRHPTST